MPDVLTHLLVGISIALLVCRKRERPEQMLIVLGAIIIDIERPLSWILNLTEYYWVDLGSAFHSILGGIVLAYFCAACFDLEDTDFRNRFILISIGCISHLLLDLVMYPWDEHGLFILYPLKVRFSFHLFWNDYWGLPIIGMISLILTLLVVAILNKRESSNL